MKTLFVISQGDDNQVVGAVNVDDTCEEVSLVKIEFDEDGDIKVTQIDREIIIVPLGIAFACAIVVPDRETAELIIAGINLPN